jgi:hypothetical protein
MWSLLSLAVWINAAAVAAAAVACGLGRWRLAAGLGRAVTLASGVLLLVVAGFVVRPVRPLPSDSSLKATMLSKGASEALNCRVLAIGAALTGVGIWAVARARLRPRNPAG